MQSIVADLMPASRHQDHTPSPSAALVVRLSTWPRPPHPAPTSVTIAKRPSCGSGMAGIDKAVSSKRRSEIFFAEGVDMGVVGLPSDLPVGQITTTTNRPSPPLYAGRARASSAASTSSRYEQSQIITKAIGVPTPIAPPAIATKSRSRLAPSCNRPDIAVTPSSPHPMLERPEQAGRLWLTKG